jgi:hypothetical protein
MLHLSCALFLVMHQRRNHRQLLVTASILPDVRFIASACPICTLEKAYLLVPPSLPYNAQSMCSCLIQELVVA